MAEEEGNGLKKLIIIAISIIIVLSLIGFVMIKFVNPESVDMNITDDENKEKEENKAKEIGPTHELGGFTVNFTDQQNYSFLKASITFELSHEKLTEELGKRDPQIRDLVISILRSQTIKDIKAPSTQNIKDEIKNKVNKNLNTGEVESVWFTQLVIQ